VDRSDFIIKLEDIPAEGLRRDLEIESFGDDGRELAVSLEGPVRASLGLTRHQDRVRLQGELSAEVKFECSRCLKEYVGEVRSEVEMFLEEEDDTVTDEEVELTAEEAGTRPLRDGRVNLREIVAEQVHLALPVKPLCREDCRGLCPRCGADLNDRSCGCGDEPHDPRWEALKKLKVK
jgi:uncharacterized protein